MSTQNAPHDGEPDAPPGGAGASPAPVAAAGPTTREFEALVDAGEAVPRERTGEQIGASAGPAVEAPPVVEGQDAASGDEPVGPLGGLLPADRPELAIAAAFAGGIVVALLIRSVARARR